MVEDDAWTTVGIDEDDWRVVACEVSGDDDCKSDDGWKSVVAIWDSDNKVK